MSESRNGNNYGYTSFSSESRSTGESRSYPTFQSSSSESRDSGESRSYSTFQSSSSESRDSGESRSHSTFTNHTYNKLDDIDELIEKYEKELPPINSTNPRVNTLIEERKKLIEELKQLKAQSIRKREEEKLINQLESQNEEIQSVIDDMKQYLKVKTNKTNNGRKPSESRW